MVKKFVEIFLTVIYNGTEITVSYSLERRVNYG